MSTRPSAIDALTADPATAGLVLDFDGVLAPIVEDPTTSMMPREVAATLAGLVKSLGLLAIISGRPVDFLAERIDIPGIPLLGSYGIEQIQAGGQRHIDPQTESWLRHVQRASRTLSDVFANSPGIRIEQKTVSVAVHWRQAPDHDLAACEVHQAVSKVAIATGLRVEPGKLVEELRPPIAVDKGTAIADLLRTVQLKTVAYAGDDLGDIPALMAVRGVGGYALIVDHGSETDPRLRDLADQIYQGTETFAAWLKKLADTIGARQHAV